MTPEEELLWGYWYDELASQRDIAMFQAIELLISEGMTPSTVCDLTPEQLTAMTGFTLEAEDEIPIFVNRFDERYAATCRSVLEAAIENALTASSAAPDLTSSAK